MLPGQSTMFRQQRAPQALDYRAEYAPALKIWINQIQESARQIAWG